MAEEVGGDVSWGEKTGWRAGKERRGEEESDGRRIGVLAMGSWVRFG